MQGWPGSMGFCPSFATPIGAPTWPPWVALRASNDVSPQAGAHAEREGSHAGFPAMVPHASTTPPPVTRHAAMTVVVVTVVVVVEVEVLLEVEVLVEVELLVVVEVLVLVEVD